ncbi:hypothetical protein OG607_44885 [Streptomyces sp. NBC_01537]|uniref:hypothetical protein n=1 Tax=Streptomyces sp. NBC_01537 TaxID=2903896 RepID=UPI00386EA657
MSVHSRGQMTRVFVSVVAVTVEHPDRICQDAHVGHRWIDTISISGALNSNDDMLRIYYAVNTWPSPITRGRRTQGLAGGSLSMFTA